MHSVAYYQLRANHIAYRLVIIIINVLSGRLSQSRPNNIKGGLDVRPSTKSFPDLNEIWYVGRGQWVLHGGMQYDAIQGQGQGHETFKVWNSAIFNMYLLPISMPDC